jgi:hypothetical protein
MSISRRIYFSMQQTLPFEFLSTILNLFQTCTVTEFNDHFKALTTDRRKELSDRRIALLQSTAVTSPTFFQEVLETIQRLCDSANNIYEQMVCDGLWKNTIKTRPTSTSHVLTASTIFSFNCGEPHHLNDCPKPKDKHRIDSNKSKFRIKETIVMGYSFK